MPCLTPPSRLSFLFCCSLIGTGMAQAGPDPREAHPRKDPRRATPGPAARPATRTRVAFLANRNEQKLSLSILRAVKSHMADLDLDLRTYWVDRQPPDLPSQVHLARRIAARSRSLVAVWCSLPSLDRVLMYIARTREGRILVRKVDQKRDGVMGKFEVIGAIVRSGVEAILQRTEIGERPPALPPPRPKRMGPKQQRRTRPSLPVRRHRGKQKNSPRKVFLELGYAPILGFSREKPVVHQGSLGVGLRLHPNWSLLISYSIAPRIIVEPNDFNMALRLTQHTLRAGGVFSWPFGRWSLSLEAAPVLHIQTYSIDARQPLRASPDGRNVTFGFFLAVEGSFRVTRWLSVFLDIGATLLLWNRTYDVSSQGSKHLILDPFVAQPQIIFGFRFDLVGREGRA